MGAFIILVSAIIATAAAVFQRILQNAENDKAKAIRLSTSAS
jgi:uncharacterized protein YpmB